MSDDWSNNSVNCQYAHAEYDRGYKDAVRKLVDTTPHFEKFDVSPSRDFNMAGMDSRLPKLVQEINNAHQLFVNKDAELNNMIAYVREHIDDVKYMAKDPNTTGKYDLKNLAKNVNPKYEYPNFLDDDKYYKALGFSQFGKITNTFDILNGTEYRPMFNEKFKHAFKPLLLCGNADEKDFGEGGKLAALDLGRYYTDDQRINRVYNEIAPKYDMLYLDDRTKRMELDSLYLPDKYFNEKYSDQTASEKEHIADFLARKDDIVYGQRLNELACELCTKTAYNNKPFGEPDDYNTVVDFDWISQYFKIQDQASNVNNWQDMQKTIYQDLAQKTSQDVVNCGKYFIDQAIISLNKYGLDTPNFGKMVKHSLDLADYPKNGYLYQSNGKFDNSQETRRQYVQAMADHLEPDFRNQNIQDQLFDLTVARFSLALREHRLRQEYKEIKQYDDVVSNYRNHPESVSAKNTYNRYCNAVSGSAFKQEANHYDPNQNYYEGNTRPGTISEMASQDAYRMEKEREENRPWNKVKSFLKSFKNHDKTNDGPDY